MMMRLPRFLSLMLQMITSNGHFVAWIPLERDGYEGWLVTARTGGRFLLVAREVSAEEAAKMVEELIAENDDEDGAEQPH